MRLRREDPHALALCKDGSRWRVPLDEAPAFEEAWTAGRAFWFGTDLWGSKVVVKLGDIVGFVVVTAASIALQDAEDIEERHRKMLSGEEA